MNEIKRRFSFILDQSHRLHKQVQLLVEFVVFVNSFLCVLLSTLHKNIFSTSAVLRKKRNIRGCNSQFRSHIQNQMLSKLLTLPISTKMLFNAFLSCSLAIIATLKRNLHNRQFVKKTPPTLCPSYSFLIMSSDPW